MIDEFFANQPCIPWIDSFIKSLKFILLVTSFSVHTIESIASCSWQMQGLRYFLIIFNFKEDISSNITDTGALKGTL